MRRRKVTESVELPKIPCDVTITKEIENPDAPVVIEKIQEIEYYYAFVLKTIVVRDSSEEIKRILAESPSEGLHFLHFLTINEQNALILIFTGFVSLILLSEHSGIFDTLKECINKWRYYSFLFLESNDKVLCKEYLGTGLHVDQNDINVAEIEYKSLVMHLKLQNSYSQVLTCDVTSNLNELTFIQLINLLFPSVFTYFIRRHYFGDYLHVGNLVVQYQENDFVTLRPIGQGGRGIVDLVMHKTYGDLMVKKVFFTKGKNSERFFRRELQTLTDYKNPMILRLFGYIKSRVLRNIDNALIMEFKPKGSLHSLLQAEKENTHVHGFTNTTKSKILYGIICGIDYLHSKGIMHRDIKSHNILLSYDFIPCLSDFDSAKNYSSSSNHTSDVGTYIYESPELLKGREYSYTTDIYSFGLIIYEMITNERPFIDCQTIMEIIRNIEDGNIPKLPDGTHERLREIYDLAMSTDPTKRPTAGTLRNNIFCSITLFPGTIPINFNNYKLYINELCQVITDNRIDIALLEEKAMTDDESLVQLAEIYEEGVLLPKDLLLATEYYKLACHNNHIHAMSVMSNYLFKGELIAKDLFQVNLYMKMAADSGDGFSQFDYALFLYKGHFGYTDIEGAIHYYKLAIENGDSYAMTNLALMYMKGENVEKNINLYLDLIHQAAVLGDKFAQFQLGKDYYHGYHVKQNYHVAFRYFQLAAEQALPDALDFMCLMLQKGLGVKKNLELAHYYLKSSLLYQNKEKYKNNLYNLALIEEELGYQETAIKHYQEAADLGMLEAYVQLGCIYEYQLNDMEKAFEYIKKGTELHEPKCAYKMSIYLFDSDPKQAKKYLKFSVSHKFNQAQNFLAHIYFEEKKYDKALFYFLEAYSNGVEEADYFIGLIYHETDQTDRAIPFLIHGVEREDVMSMNLLGGFCFLGTSVQQDIAKGLELTKKAADMGSIDACINYTNYQLAIGSNAVSEFLPYLIKAADSGNINSQYLAGKILFERYDDDKKAIPYLVKASKHGHPKATYYLGMVFKQQKKYNYSLVCFKKATKLNVEKAFYEVGVMCFKGRVAPQNVEEAYYYFTRALEYFPVLAKKINYYFGQIEFIDGHYDQAIDYFLKASANGNSSADYQMYLVYKVLDDDERAQSMLLRAAGKGNAKAYYQIGLDKMRDGLIDEAFDLFTKSSQNGNKFAAYDASKIAHSQNNKELELMFLLCSAGLGFEKAFIDLEKFGYEKDQDLVQFFYHYNMKEIKTEGTGLNLWSKANNYRILANEGNINAAFNYGVLCLKGQGVPKDQMKAVEYLTMAANGGHSKAQYLLKSLND